MTTLQILEPPSTTNGERDIEQALPAAVVGEKPGPDGVQTDVAPVYTDIEHTVVTNDPRKWSKMQKVSITIRLGSL